MFTIPKTQFQGLLKSGTVSMTFLAVFSLVNQPMIIIVKIECGSVLLFRESANHL